MFKWNVGIIHHLLVDHYFMLYSNSHKHTPPIINIALSLVSLEFLPFYIHISLVPLKRCSFQGRLLYKGYPNSHDKGNVNCGLVKNHIYNFMFAFNLEKKSRPGIGEIFEASDERDI